MWYDLGIPMVILPVSTTTSTCEPGGSNDDGFIPNVVNGEWHRSTVTEYLEDAITLADHGRCGNEASLFISCGFAAPMAFFPFSRWKDSFLGDLHGQVIDAVDLFTQNNIVAERWPKEWSQTF